VDAEQALAELRVLYSLLGQLSKAAGPYTAQRGGFVTSTDERRINEAQQLIARQYGKTKELVRQGFGGTPNITSGGVSGDPFVQLLQHPRGNPLFIRCLKGAIEITNIAIGHFDGLATAPRPKKAIAGASPLALMSPRVQDASEKLYADGHHREAVLAAATELVTLLRELTNAQQLDGLPLVDHALAPKSPRLRINSMQSQTDRDEHRGFYHLCQGVILAFRHPAAHGGPTPSALDAYTSIALIDMLMRRLAAAVTT
jgi:uncharacterized protein (TIGR02391 family)